MNIQEKIDVLIAYRDGKEIEFTNVGENHWWPAVDPMFNFNMFSYRVKKEPEIIFEVVGQSGLKVLVGRGSGCLSDSSWRILRRFKEIVDE